MNILIVDDEVFTVRAIQTTLAWESLGIEKAFSAYNAAKAREIILQEKIDLMICDIEMPREDGLSLVTWLRDQGYVMEVIFLTCHSEFEYARRALKLQVFDYVVKPVDFAELQKVVGNAVDRIEEERQKDIKTQMGEYWMENKQVVEQRFWQSLLTDGASKSPEEIEKDAHKQNIRFDKDTVYRLILVSVKKIRTLLDNWNDELLLFTMQNLAREIILEDLYSNRTIEAGDKFLIISETCDEASIRQLCTDFAAVCKKYVGTSVYCYVSNGVFCEEFPQTWEALCQVEKNDVTGNAEIVFVTGGGRAVESSQNPVADIDAHPAADISTPDDSDLLLPDSMKELLYRGDRGGFLTLYRAFIHKTAASGRLNYNVLNNIQQDLLQYFFVYMERRSVRAHKISWLNSESVTTVAQLDRWVEKCLDTLMSDTGEKTAGSTELMVRKIKEYVLAHLDEELTRENIAAQVNLSPDYMSKVFKTEMNTTLSQYIIDERMEKAVLLMRTTRLNVSRIAMEVGYGNFSYFTKLFKKHTGLTPREYRLKMDN